MKAIVVEDELYPRLTLIQKLAEYHPEVEIIAQCEDADSALKAILGHRPDVLFLDIQLKEKDSLWLLEQLYDATVLPYIIFTTAYNDPNYLLKAIKYAAVDYLLKPIDIIELSRAIKKVKERMAGQNGFPNEPKTHGFRTFNSTLVAKADDILYVKADGNYSNMFLITDNEETIFERLGEIERKLADEPGIVRAGKSHLVNKKYIYKIEYKKRICVMQTPSGKQYKVELSAGGMDDINIMRAGS